jgi:hypothetical protein
VKHQHFDVIFKKKQLGTKDIAYKKQQVPIYIVGIPAIFDFFVK